MIEWKDPVDKEHKSWAEIAGLALSASPTGHWSIMPKRGGMVIASGRHPACTLTAAKADAEAAAGLVLRELHSELTKHFAPVLRWTHGERESTATLGQWQLFASDSSWSVSVSAFGEWSVPVKGSRGPTTRANNCSAAETSLRSLGVAFRTEDGQ